ncbi:MAG: carboxypeptidase regulatory-like domain-containing protein [Gammaproteobacteria bacterium]|nr:carboxypeptidase regulatory-like domain-containing protein [Gammaproteobacteria bacterium]
MIKINEINRPARSWIVFVILIFVLQGCGSGGDGTFSFSESLTLTGFVTDQPIANATVTVTVGNRSFEADGPTDALGAYTVNIGTNDTDSLVFANAVEPMSGVSFVAFLGDFADLQLQADIDDVVADADITHLTTGQFVGAESETTDGSIDSVEEFETAVLSSNWLTLATAIQFVVDGIDGVVLPSEFDDTLALARAIADGSTTFLSTLDSDTFTSVLDAIIADDSIGFADVSEVPGSYMIPELYLSIPGFDLTGLTFSDTHENNVTLFADGSGHWSYVFESTDPEGGEAHRVSPVAWSLTEDNELEMTLEDPTVWTVTVTRIEQFGSVFYSNIVAATSGITISVSGNSTAIDGFDSTLFDALTVPGSYQMTDTDNPNEFFVMQSGGGGYVIDISDGMMGSMFGWQVTDVALELDMGTDGTETIYRLDGSTDSLINATSIRRDQMDNIEEISGMFGLTYTSEIFDGPIS